ncbi:hypothetical protein JCM10207_002444 [Rhodosporidiobolus poonsookiae]
MAAQSSTASASSALPILTSASSPPAAAAAPPPGRRSPFKRYLAPLRPRWRLTLLGRCIALVLGEIGANAALWVAAGIVWGRKEETRGVLSLAIVAWTLGLRHGLDMDHIVAIDNVTRNLVSLGQLPVTVGLFFSLGHSSIVIAMTIAVIVTVSAIDKLPDISSVGGVIGVCVSASFLFALALINSIVLWQSIRLARRRKQARLALAAERADVVPIASSSASPVLNAAGELDPIAKKLPDEEEARANADEHEHEVVPGLPATTCIARIGRPIFRLIDRPWKMYPVGVLFGFGFDTASEISLLGVSALAKGTHHIPSAQIILLPLLFTAGMTAVDSLDSIFMLSAYTVPQRTLAGEFDYLKEDSKSPNGEGAAAKESWISKWRKLQIFERRPVEGEQGTDEDEAEARARRLPAADPDRLLSISVVLTVISIVVALLISITEFMGLALEKCAKCSDAAENDSGLSGRWWRFWQAVNDNSGYLGAGVVGLFIVVFATWGVAHWLQGRKAKKAAAAEGER